MPPASRQSTKEENENDEQICSIFYRKKISILADWPNVDPIGGSSWFPDPYEALEKLGFNGKADGYSESDAAVASIILELVQNRLPQWSAARQKEGSEELQIIVGRQLNSHRAERITELLPQHLMTINWADSGPGYSWPVAYHVTWVPLYDKYIVTESADSPDAHGYCDFAIGSFGPSDDFVREAANEIENDWGWQRNQFCQFARAYLFETGLIDEMTAYEIRGKVWGDDID